MRRYLLLAVPFLASLILNTSAAQAVVIDMSAVGSGSTTVLFNNAARSEYYGVALVPGARTAPYTTPGVLRRAGIPYVVSGGRCLDPALTTDLFLPATGLCYHGGPVMHRNETFALTWDPLRRYWSGTRNYLEQFLRDVADGSGTLTSPFAVTSQYSDGTGRAENASRYGGGCIDYGNPNHMANQNTTCLLGNSVQTGPGFNYPASGCPATGDSYTDHTATNPFSLNDTCLTDAQLRAQVSAIVTRMGILHRTQPGYRPMIVLPLPPGVETCLDAAGRLCSANGNVTAPQPALTPTTTPGTGALVPPGTYHVEITYVTGSGQSTHEWLPGISQTVTIAKPDPSTTNAGTTVTIASPPDIGGATGWYAYVTQPGGTTYSRQQSAPSPIGSSFTLATLPVTSGPPPPVPTTPLFFCSYHSQVNVHGTEVAYVVAPWTAMTNCDEPDAPAIPANPPPDTLSKAVGVRLVSPLSQGEMAAITNPQFDGWFAHQGLEINDNSVSSGVPGVPPTACAPLAGGLDRVVVGTSSQNPYLLQREFNNAGVMENDPFTYFGCAPGVVLTPSFVVPSPIDQGEVVGFDGSATASTLIVPNASYSWSFGDGSTAHGPSVVHSFAKAGNYAVTMTVTDRGGNVRTLTQRVEVLGPQGQPPSTGGGRGGSSHRLKVGLQLLPQSLRAVLRNGLSVRVRSNEAANGFATLWISWSAAHRAHLASNSRHSLVAVGRGTVSGIKNGAVTLRVRVSSATAKRLARATRLTLTLHLTLFARNGARATASAVGRY